MIKYVPIGLSVIIFLVFGYTLLNDSLNAPSFDDYDATLSFIKKFYFEQQTFAEKIGLLFSRHNEHRIFLSRFVAVAYYYFFHQLNFSHLVIFQNIFLLGSFALMIVLMTRNKMPFPTALLIGSVYLFNLSFYQVSFYYWGGIQYYTVFFFSMLSLFLLNKSVASGSFNFLAGVFFVLVAVFSFGNGFLALFLGAFVLFAQKKYKLLIIWSILTVILLFVLFYAVPQIERPDRQPFNIEWLARLLFTFTGSFLFINPPAHFWRYFNIVVCSVAGIGVLFYWVRLFFNGYATKNPLLYSLFSLPILTGIIISISRFDTKSAGGVAPRYMFFTAFIPIMLVLILWDRKVLKTSQLNIIAILGVLLWGFNFYNNRAELRMTNADIADRIEKWKKDPTTRLIYYRQAADYAEIMKWSTEHKIIPGINPVSGAR